MCKGVDTHRHAGHQQRVEGLVIEEGKLETGMLYREGPERYADLATRAGSSCLQPKPPAVPPRKRGHDGVGEVLGLQGRLIA
mmetsp:Transcript_18004/g.39916  ORF Transcript_18004/g.39916 Transcript_18004/m.39916 type:complete len:82 (-) Transcript_18004:56-301(-)